MKIFVRRHRYTFTIAFCSTLKELQDLASQHELISENIRECSIKQIQNTVKECREQRKKCLDEYAKIKRQLDKQHELMIKVRLSFSILIRSDINIIQLVNSIIKLSRGHFKMQIHSCKNPSRVLTFHLCQTNQLNNLFLISLYENMKNAMNQHVERRIAMKKRMKIWIYLELNWKKLEIQ